VDGMNVVLYDSTTDDVLEASWVLGARLYRLRGDADAYHAMTSFPRAVDWMLALDRPISQIQIWCHGDFGAFLVGGERYRASSVADLSSEIELLREALLPNAVVWWRTCRTFSSRPGQHFARVWAEALGCRVAGHTHDIGIWQSGLRTLAPGDDPSWSVLEGNTRDPSRVGFRARPSRPWAPRTVTCLTGKIPRGW